MLQFEMLPPSFAAVLVTLRPCFTAPTFRMFAVLVAGMIAMPQRRTVTGMLTGAGLAVLGGHARAYWFFSRAVWSVQKLSAAVTALVINRLLPAGAPVLIAVDDTLFRRSGRKVHGTAWHYDGAAKTPKGTKKVAWGNNWIIAAIVVTLPMLDRPVSLPVGFALWSKAGPTKQVLACQLITLIAATCPSRAIHVVADSHYAGADGAPGATLATNRQRGLPTGITLTASLRANAKLHAIATPVPGKGGRPKRIGAVLGTPQHLAASTTAWTLTTVTRYQRTDTVHIADTHCLWYGAYRSREIRVILVREPTSTTKTGYDLALITTDLTTPAAQIITRYAARWSIEVAIEDAKQITGAGQTRTPNAVTRTVPFALLTQTLTIIWYTQHGDPDTTVAQRRTEAPWYTTKTQPAYHDMITTLRRTLITARFRARRPHQPTPEETNAVLLSWAQAAA
jgi:hypothetical protein